MTDLQKELFFPVARPASGPISFSLLVRHLQERSSQYLDRVARCNGWKTLKQCELGSKTYNVVRPSRSVEKRVAWPSMACASPGRRHCVLLTSCEGEIVVLRASRKEALVVESSLGFVGLAAAQEAWHFQNQTSHPPSNSPTPPHSPGRVYLRTTQAG